MHWAVFLPPVVAAVVFGGVVLYRQYMQEMERNQQYWAPFEHAVPATAGPQPRLVEQLLASVEARLRHLRGLPPGPDRTRRIRALRAEYHPDRYVGLGPEMQGIAAEVSAVVNTRTEPLLREDREAAAAQQ
jgi:hypothetical protein